MDIQSEWSLPVQRQQAFTNAHIHVMTESIFKVPRGKDDTLKTYEGDFNKTDSASFCQLRLSMPFLTFPS